MAIRFCKCLFGSIVKKDTIVKPLVSIIVPIYKVEPYLRRCLDSIINQTYTYLEIILVDDGSPDSCPQLCDEYAAKDKRIVVIHKENGGLSDARNVGTLKAIGNYLYYLDSDDELPPNAIEIMVATLQEQPNAEIIIGKMHCPQNEALYNEQLFNSTHIFENNKDIRSHFFSSENRLPVNACNKLISRKFLLEKNIFFKKGIIHEDNLWMFLVVQSLNKAVCLNHITYIRYLNPGSITTGSSEDEIHHSLGMIFIEIFNKIDSFLFEKQFYHYLLQFRAIHPHMTSSQKILYQNVWDTAVACAQRNNHILLAFALYCHRKFYKILRGHGTGFIIWFLLTKCSQSTSIIKPNTLNVS